MRHATERIIAVSNPVSTRHAKAKRAIGRLRDVFGSRVHEHHTLPSRHDTADMLRDTVREGDIVAMLGGDGTAGMAVEALADPTVSAHGAYLLPLPFGNQNDLSRQLYGNRRSADPAQIIHDAHQVSLTPLSVTVEYEGTERYLSALYAGIGFMAHAAYFQESAKYRSHWMYRRDATRDAYALQLFPWVMRHAEPFRATVDGVERELTDITVANVPVVAKYLHPPVDFVAEEACYLEIQRKSLREIGTYIARLAIPRYLAPPAHELMRGCDDTSSVTVHDTTYLHTDGVGRELPAGAIVTIGLHDSRYQALTTRL